MRRRRRKRYAWVAPQFWGYARLWSMRMRRRLAVLTRRRPSAPWVRVVSNPRPNLLALLNRILGLPRLALPLAQEAPWCRPLIATRVIRTGAMMTMLVGAEPIPLLDLPLHVAIQWKVALQLAAMYGRPGLDYRSRDVGNGVTNLCMRQMARQALKVIPLIGWLLSGLLSGVSTWLLGNALRRYYEQEHLWEWQGVRRWVGAWRQWRPEDKRREDKRTGGRKESPESEVQGLDRTTRLRHRLKIRAASF